MSKPKEELIGTYANILDEIRVRIMGINTILNATSALPSWLTAELGYIQLRMLCELVALGCLTVHGEIQGAQSKRLLKQFAADNIIGQLERLHPDFYPHPVHCTNTESGLHLDEVKSGYLTKAELISLYHECGEHLHRGSFYRVFHPTKPKRPPEIPKLVEWATKFSKLLNQHRIASISGKTQLLCFLSHQQAAGNALVAVGQSLQL